MVIVLQEGLTHIEEKCTLVHEYYHLQLYQGAVFSFHDTYQARCRGDLIETRVRRATADHLVPTGYLRKLVKRGLWPNEIAELLELTEDVVEDAIEFQIRRRGEFF